jgi:cephalosporin hydroxylase
MPNPLTRFFRRPAAPAAREEAPEVAAVRALLDRSEHLAAFRLSREHAQAGCAARGLHFLQGQSLAHLARHSEALAAYDEELRLHPDHRGARKAAEAMRAALHRPQAPGGTGADRSWHTSLPHDTLHAIQNSLHNYHYRGVPMLKNPFDVALYPMLLWQLKPRTIIEIGSKLGGSALWFGDLFESFGIDGHVHSVDIVKPEGVAHPRATFHEGDGRALGGTFSEEWLAQMPRPLLVVEDADHSYETSIAVLRFFHPHFHGGEYIVIEDGIGTDLAGDLSGPHRALKEWLASHGADYEIDPAYCDFFGYNVTWCTNGFLRKRGAAS